MALSGLEELKSALNDSVDHIKIAKILSVHPSETLSFVKVKVLLFPEEQPAIARMTWDFIGGGKGAVTLPKANDMVLVAFSDAGEDDSQAFIIGRLSSSSDKIPAAALLGDTVIDALSKLWINGDKIYLATPGSGLIPPTENLVLGQVFKAWAEEFMDKVVTILDALIVETHGGNLGFNTTPPINAASYVTAKAALTALKASKLTSDLILSDKAFTEK